jgi:ribose-phosphate pyrophosphokinase
MVMFPDAGAEKKYGMPSTAIVGKKTRDEPGRISSYELVNFVDGTENVLIRDDICSYGGTFVTAAKALRERGVKNIKLLVSHCEDNILKGEVFDYIDEVITTDTICKVEHPKLRIVDRFR